MQIWGKGGKCMKIPEESKQSVIEYINGKKLSKHKAISNGIWISGR